MQTALLTALVRFLTQLVMVVQPLAPEAPPLIGFQELLARPENWIGHEVRFVVQVKEVLPRWEPYLTRFSPDSYVGLSGWADEQSPWEASDWGAPAVRVFARRGGAAARRLQARKPHERVLVYAVVREMLLGQPWVEVSRVFVKKRYVPEGSVLHAIRGEELAARGAWSLAVSEFDRALVGPLPASAALHFEARRDSCAKASLENSSRRIEVPVKGPGEVPDRAPGQTEPKR